MTFLLLAALCLGLVYNVSAHPGGNLEREEVEVDKGFAQRETPVLPPPAVRQKRSSCSDLPDDIPNEAWQNIMVDEHNTRRLNEASEQGSSNENKLTYNQELAKLSQLRANKCIWDHGDYTFCNGTSVGQNMYYIGRPGGSSIDSGIAMGAMKGWYNDEKPHYDLKTISCAQGKVCGHYTQVIWAVTEMVGCGAHICDKLYQYKDGVKVIYRDTPTYDYTLVICDYSPPGNYVGQKPFREGGVCSACKGDTGVSCYNDTLCAKCNHLEDENCECPNKVKCEKNGGTIDTTEENCVCNCGDDSKGGEACEIDCIDKPGDASSSCNYWKSSGYCAPGSVYSAFMQQNCKDTCACN
ncbi:unnamed protein product [Owenia fusiformis]|uniref:Uncharacterized protein n=1 Tax=Owenia fusiformis TaxID=6347 RepID=A0A8J1TM69_OWEFU|nr:unnamed protein product [Owenia fusiformis]